MRVKMTLAAAALAGLTMMLLSGSAAADTIKVPPGGSIQAAIDQADPGDTIKLAPGTYQESVQIKTDGITLKGAGADESVIEPGAGSGQGFCDGQGICVADVDVQDPTAPPVINNHVADVRIKDLKVQGFAATGVFFFGTRDQRVDDVVAEGNGEYGIAAFETTGGRYWDTVTSGSGEAGLYVGDSENADAVLRDNVATDNGIGIFIRDAAHGLVEDNRASDNCIGMLFLDTPDDPAAPRPNSDWIARDNSVNHNNKACSGEEGDSSGIGIAIDGAHRITLVGNTASGNQPSGPTPGSGGIIVLTEPGFPTATDNLIEHNTAFGNLPFDLLWDQQGTNTFTGNRCGTSNPDGLCVSGGHGHGHGHGHHGNDGDDDHHGGNGDNGRDRKGDHGNKHNGKHHKHHKHKSSSRNRHV
jgi:parallel beta-helix repeat protein